MSLAMVASSVIGDAGYNVDCDLDLDGDVDLTDLSLATTNYQPALPGGSVSLSEIGNPYGYTGALHSPEIDLSLFRNRWYSAVLGRWVERDPAGYVDGLNLYLYVGGNPILLIDPLGLKRWYEKVIDSIVDAGAGAADSLSFGLTKQVREWTGIDRGTIRGIYTDEPAYQAGNVGTTIVTSVSPKGVANAVTNAPKIIKNAPGIISGVVDTIKDIAKLAGRTSDEAARIVGQVHHPISKKVHDALERHPNLKGRYTNRDPRFETRAIDSTSHKGYQQWHRDLDDEVVKWIDENPNATPEEFEKYLRERYSQPDLRDRFPDGVCENPINLH